MRKIIDGKIYDTETATLLAQNWEGGGESDFRYFEEYLYITKKGALFIHGVGGGLSRYARTNSDGTTTRGQKIRVVQPKEMINFYYENKCIKNDDYDHLFPLEEA